MEMYKVFMWQMVLDLHELTGIRLHDGVLNLVYPNIQYIKYYARKKNLEIIKVGRLRLHRSPFKEKK